MAATRMTRLIQIAFSLAMCAYLGAAGFLYGRALDVRYHLSRHVEWAAPASPDGLWYNLAADAESYASQIVTLRAARGAPRPTQESEPPPMPPSVVTNAQLLEQHRRLLERLTENAYYNIGLAEDLRAQRKTRHLQDEKLRERRIYAPQERW